MNDQDIEMFMKAFDDFMQHAETEELNYEMRSEYEEYSKMIIDKEIEKKAAELEVTCDYYIQEFM
jgi:hypothetical protein